jgi:hypothetical protein
MCWGKNADVFLGRSWEESEERRRFLYAWTEIGLSIVGRRHHAPSPLIGSRTAALVKACGPFFSRL